MLKFPSLPGNAAGRNYVIVAYIEALTWTGLLTGMVLKHVTGTTEIGVSLFGPVHGLAFLVYVTVTVMAAIRLRWNWPVAAIALLAAVPPLGTLLAERWLRQRGELEAGQDAAQSI